MTPGARRASPHSSLVDEVLTLGHLVLGDAAAATDVVVRALAARPRDDERPGAAEDLRRRVLDGCLRAGGRWAAVQARLRRRLRSESTPPGSSGAAGADALGTAPVAGAVVTAALDAAEAERQALWLALGDLSVLQRAVVILRWYDERSDEEIAEVLDVSPGTVRQAAQRGLWLARDVLREEPSEDLVTPGARGEVRPHAPAGVEAAEELLVATMHDPRRVLRAPEELPELLRRADVRHRKGRRRAGASVVAVVALGAASVAVAEREPRPDPVPSASSGLLPWAPRGALADDADLRDRAGAAWRTVEPGAPRRPSVLWAGMIGQGRVVVLEGLDSRGRPRVAQLGEGGEPRRLVLQHTADLPRSAVPALVVTYDGDLSRGESSPPGWAKVQLLLSPGLVPRPGSGEELDLRSRSVTTVGLAGTPLGDYPRWRLLARLDEGMTVSRVQRDDARPMGALWRLATSAAIPLQVQTVGTKAGSLLPIPSAVSQGIDLSGDGLASPEVIDDVDAAFIAASSPTMRAQGLPSPVTVRALSTQGEQNAGPWRGVRVALLDVEASGRHDLLLVARRGTTVICQQRQPIAGDPARLTVVGAGCLMRGGDPDTIVAAGWSNVPRARINVLITAPATGTSSEATAQRQRVYIGMGPGSGVAIHTVTGGAPPTGPAVWQSSVPGQPVARWTSPPVDRAR